MAAKHQTSYIARQPIFDAARAVRGYELLYRCGPYDRATFTDGEEATMTLLMDASMTWGLEELVGDHLAFVNMTAAALRSGLYRVLPPDHAVLEILESIEVDDSVVDAVAVAKGAGYQVALDDFVPGSPHDALLELADIVKLEVNGRSVEQIAKAAGYVDGKSDATLLAEKVETVGEMAACVEIGFRLFQGYLLGRPETLER